MKRFITIYPINNCNCQPAQILNVFTAQCIWSWSSSSSESFCTASCEEICFWSFSAFLNFYSVFNKIIWPLCFVPSMVCFVAKASVIDPPLDIMTFKIMKCFKDLAISVLFQVQWKNCDIHFNKSCQRLMFICCQLTLDWQSVFDKVYTLWILPILFPRLHNNKNNIHPFCCFHLTQWFYPCPSLITSLTS